MPLQTAARVGRRIGPTGPLQVGASDRDRRLHGVARRGERHEEGVSLHTNLDTGDECLTEEPIVVLQNLAKTVTECVDERSRTLDVGEEKHDGSGREAAHHRSVGVWRALAVPTRLATGVRRIPPSPPCEPFAPGTRIGRRAQWFARFCGGAMRSDRAHRWVPAAIAGLLLAVSVMPLIPPAAPGGEDAGSFDVDRAMAYIGVIARAPHPMGSAENERVRQSIIESLETLGLEPELQQLTVPDYFRGGDGTVQTVNVMARIPGLAPSGAVALVGHYDSSPTTPGANDNAAAVAALLEVARVILDGDQLRNDVVLLFTDGEEPAPRYGSTAFVEGHPWAPEIGAVVNLEAIGGSGPSMVVATNGPETWLIDGYAELSPAPVAHSYVTAISRLIGGSNTDFAPFRDRGVAGIEFAYLHDSPIYHTADDAPGRVGRRSLYQHGTNAAAMVRHLGEVDLADLPDPSTGVFFTVGRQLVVRYSDPVGAVIGVLAWVFLFAAGLRARRSSRLPMLSLLRAGGVTVAGLVASMLFGALVWMAYATARPSPRMVEGYLVLTVMVGLVATWAISIRRKPPPVPDGGAFGVVATWSLLALATGLLVPGMGYLFGWPALAGALWLTARPSKRLTAVAWFSAIAASAFVVMTPAIDTLFQLAQPRPGNTDSQLIPFAGLSTALAFLVAALVAAAWPSGRAPQPVSDRMESLQPTRK
jgi:hypothetical protein